MTWVDGVNWGGRCLHREVKIKDLNKNIKNRRVSQGIGASCGMVNGRKPISVPQTDVLIKLHSG